MEIEQPSGQNAPAKPGSMRDVLGAGTWKMDQDIHGPLATLDVSRLPPDKLKQLEQTLAHNSFSPNLYSPEPGRLELELRGGDASLLRDLHANYIKPGVAANAPSTEPDPTPPSGGKPAPEAQSGPSARERIAEVGWQSGQSEGKHFALTNITKLSPDERADLKRALEQEGLNFKTVEGRLMSHLLIEGKEGVGKLNEMRGVAEVPEKMAPTKASPPKTPIDRIQEAGDWHLGASAPGRPKAEVDLNGRKPHEVAMLQNALRREGIREQQVVEGPDGKRLEVHGKTGVDRIAKVTQPVDRQAGRLESVGQVAVNLAEGNYGAAAQQAALAAGSEALSSDKATKLAGQALEGAKESSGLMGRFGKLALKRIPVVGAVITAGVTAFTVGSLVADGQYKKAAAEAVAGVAETAGAVAGGPLADIAREGARAGMLFVGGRQFEAEHSGIVQLAQQTGHLAAKRGFNQMAAAPADMRPEPTLTAAGPARQISSHPAP